MDVLDAGRASGIMDLVQNNITESDEDNNLLDLDKENGQLFLFDTTAVDDQKLYTFFGRRSELIMGLCFLPMSVIGK